MPLVSVIIPCFRQAQFLPHAVRSVLEQTVQDVEVVVVDDGSPDDPIARLGSMASDPRVVTMRQQNRGLALARNAGLAASHALYLVFLDADDWLAPAFCERLASVLNRDPEWGFAYSDIHRVYDEPASGVPKHELEYSVGASRSLLTGAILPSLLIGGYFPPNAVMIPRPVLERVGPFDPELGGHADWDLWMRILATGYGARYVDEKLAYYRLHGANMSRDQEHMRATRVLALAKLLRSSPDVAAAALHEVSRTAEEQYQANQAVQQILTELDARNIQLNRHIEEQERQQSEYFAESQAWMKSLKEAQDWHQQQATQWKEAAESCATQLSAGQARMESLEEATARLQDEISHLRTANTGLIEDRKSLQAETLALQEANKSLAEIRAMLQLPATMHSLHGWWVLRKRHRQS